MGHVLSNMWDKSILIEFKSNEYFQNLNILHSQYICSKTYCILTVKYLRLAVDRIEQTDPPRSWRTTA